MLRTVRKMLARSLLLAGLASFPLIAGSRDPGCGAAMLDSGTHTIVHGGLTRTFRLYVPPGYRRGVPAPMVVVFHGWGGNEDEFLGESAVIDAARARGYILVAPRGLGSAAPDRSHNSWTFSGSATGLGGDGARLEMVTVPAPICDTALTPDYRYPSCKAGIANNSCSWTQCQDDDIDFSLVLVHYIESRLCVDAKRVFASGGSNGGMFTWELGQNPRSAPTFRAIAPLIGLPHRGYLGGPGRPGRVPVLLITGLNDHVVPPGAWESDAFTTTSNGSDRYYYTGATAIAQRWAVAAGCDTSRKARVVDHGRPEADCRTYCPASGSRWPAVIDCRAPMGHDYGLPWSWKLIMDFFDHS